MFLSRHLAFSPNARRLVNGRTTSDTVESWDIINLENEDECSHIGIVKYAVQHPARVLGDNADVEAWAVGIMESVRRCGGIANGGNCWRAPISFASEGAVAVFAEACVVNLGEQHLSQL